MNTRFDHFTCLANRIPTSFVQRIVYSELPRGDYEIQASPFGINLVLEGEEIYEVAGSRLRVAPGDMLVIGAGLPVRVVLEGSTINRALCVSLPHELGSVLADSAVGSRQWPGAVVLRYETSSLGQELFQGCQHTLDQSSAHRLMKSIVSHLPNFARSLGDRVRNVSAIKPATRQLLLQRLERSYATLCFEGRERISVQKLAEAAGMSLHHFARTFRDVYGMPPSRVQQCLRMEAAARAMVRGTVTPAQAAERFGFADQASFTRAFKRHVGMTPGELIRASN